MPVPSDFDSYCTGFDLTAANYSGGAGGTFANLVAGRPDWTVQGATPTFETRGALSGMLFSGLAAETIAGRMPALREATIILIGKPATSSAKYPIAGGYTISNSFSMQHASNTVAALTQVGSSGLSAGVAGGPHVYSISFSPENGTLYAQINSNTIKSTVVSPTTYAAIDYPEAFIGRRTTNYYHGWIARVLIFARALHYRDNAALQALITSEIARL